MKSKKVLALLLSAAMLLTIGGCGKSDDKKVSTTPAVTQSAIAATQPAVTASTLKDAFASDFAIGAAVNTYQLEDPSVASFVSNEFNIITMENEMKPENMLDQEGSMSSKDKMPRINEELLDKVLKLAKDNGLKVHGHVLVWHSQTPSWFFCKDYSDAEDYVDKKTMYKRMESYIKQVISYAQDNYPGVVYAWDVVNEAVADGKSGLRDENSLWYDICGEDFVEKAFEYANKYADDDVKLIYNDYNCYDATKRNYIFAMCKKLKEKGYLDGIGLQSHMDTDYPDVDTYQFTLEKFMEIEGIELQITELDMHNNDDSEYGLKKQADKYGELFKMYVDLDRSKKANITSVTFWGLNDSCTWLTSFKGETSYPLLFDGSNGKKPAYDSVMEASAK